MVIRLVAGSDVDEYSHLNTDYSSDSRSNEYRKRDKTIKLEKMLSACKNCSEKIGIGPIIGSDYQTATGMKKIKKSFRKQTRACSKYGIPLDKEPDFIRVEEDSGERLYCPKFPENKIPR